jgi:hypothetical protein
MPGWEPYRLAPVDRAVSTQRHRCRAVGREEYRACPGPACRPLGRLARWLLRPHSMDGRRLAEDRGALSRISARIAVLVPPSHPVLHAATEPPWLSPGIVTWLGERRVAKRASQRRNIEWIRSILARCRGSS